MQRFNMLVELEGVMGLQSRQIRLLNCSCVYGGKQRNSKVLKSHMLISDPFLLPCFLYWVGVLGCL